jgi:hypothetical protein
MVYERKQ